MGDFPMMTEQGTFIINGAERVVVCQLVRSPGVYYTAAEDPATGRMLFTRQGDPEPRRLAGVRDRNKDQLNVKVDRKRKLPVTTLLRAVGYENERRDRGAVRGRRHRPRAPLHRERRSRRTPPHTPGEALIEVYKKLRPGDPPTGDNAERWSRACSSTSAATTWVASAATS